MSKNHPVWDVYDQFRTTRLSCKYYSARLAQYERWNFWMEMMLAATASGSAIAALTFWQSGLGKGMWTFLTVASFLLAIAKPLLRLTAKIQRFEEVAVGYGHLDNDYQKLVIAIGQEGNLTPSLQEQFRALMDRAGDLKGMEVVERVPKEKLRRQCKEAVERELPTDRFFVPSSS